MPLFPSTTMRFVFALAFFLAVLPAAAQQSAAVPAAPALAAKSYLLIDFNSQQTLVAVNDNTRIEPASLTKLMTAYLTFTALKQKKLRPDQHIPVSERAWRAAGARMFIEPSKPVTADELIRGTIVQSGNDACIALAEAIAGSEDAFAQMMNREAKRLGMTDTNFVNSTGLPDPRHYTTARDLAVLATAIIRDFPEYYPLYSIKEYSYNRVTQGNRNRLLWSDPTVDGMKTGYTENAGYCLITSAKRGDARLISIVLGTESETMRAVESQKLLNYGFQFYDSLRVYERNQTVATLPVWKGSDDKVKAGFSHDLYLSLPKGQADKLKASIESQQPLLAPINKGQHIGTMKLMLDGRPYRELPVVALETVPVAGIFGRAWDSLRLLMR